MCREACWMDRGLGSEGVEDPWITVNDGVPRCWQQEPWKYLKKRQSSKNPQNCSGEASSFASLILLLEY